MSVIIFSIILVQLFSYRLLPSLNIWLQTDQSEAAKPMIYCNLYENTGPGWQQAKCLEPDKPKVIVQQIKTVYVMKYNPVAYIWLIPVWIDPVSKGKIFQLNITTWLPISLSEDNNANASTKNIIRFFINVTKHINAKVNANARSFKRFFFRVRCGWEIRGNKRWI